jgi:hypothetical protein
MHPSLLLAWLVAFLAFMPVFGAPVRFPRLQTHQPLIASLAIRAGHHHPLPVEARSPAEHPALCEGQPRTRRRPAQAPLHVATQRPAREFHRDSALLT